MKICVLYLTCANDKEAEKISEVLLEKKLIFCAKRFPVKSSFLWKGKIDKASEVMLIMDSIEDNFEEMKKEITKHHSYKTFVLFATPVINTTQDVRNWIKEELNK